MTHTGKLSEPCRWVVTDHSGNDHLVDADAWEIINNASLQLTLAGEVSATFGGFANFKRQIVDQDAPDSSGA